MATAKKSPAESTSASSSSSSSTSNGQIASSTQSSTPEKSDTTNPSGSTSSQSSTQESFEQYQIMPASPWPPPVFVKKNVSPQERYYLEHRWNSQWRFFDEKATQNKVRYYLLQRIVVIGSVTVPVLVGVNSDLFAEVFPIMSVETAGSLVSFSTVIISLAVAISAALEGLYKYGDMWSSYRQAAEELQAEKSFYDVGAGRYVYNPDAFSRFVERCEEIIAQQNGRFIASVEKTLQAASDQAEAQKAPEPNNSATNSVPSEPTSAG